MKLSFPLFFVLRIIFLPIKWVILLACECGMMTPVLQINQWQMIAQDYKCVSHHLVALHMFIGINVCGNAFCHQSVVLPSRIFPL